MQESKPSLGQRLKQLRLSRQISIEKAADATRIRVQYLQALEADNYSAMTSAAQGRGFLRMYADFLGFDLDSAMTELRETGGKVQPSQLAAPEIEPPVPPAPEPVSGETSGTNSTERPFWARLLRRASPRSADEQDSSISTESVSLPKENPPSEDQSKKKALNQFHR